LAVRTENSVAGTWAPTDETGRTNVSGVWAAGNLTDPAANVIAAAAAGSKAAMALNADLVEDDVERALRALPGPAPR
jgi:thioredoxin reductase